MYVCTQEDIAERDARAKLEAAEKTLTENKYTIEQVSIRIEARQKLWSAFEGEKLLATLPLSHFGLSSSSLSIIAYHKHRGSSSKSDSRGMEDKNGLRFSSRT